MKKPNLVSILTPTFNRRKFIPQYLRNIRRQDYKGPIEILIADDGEDKVEDLIPKNSIFRYIKMPEKKPIGYKRNLLCSEAKGDILINMDDDDFYPARRISHAIEKLNKKEAYIAGCSRNYLYDKNRGITQYGPIRDYYAIAGTFAFYSEYLEKNKFNDNAEIGEELDFTHHFTNPLIQLDPINTILVMCHSKNTHNKDSLPTEETKLILSDFIKDKIDYEFYVTNL
jgi:glycosyltransferase involved in cell wall biosynthesis